MTDQFEIDPRLTLFNLQQRRNGALVGEVEMPQHREILRAAKFNVEAVRLLPEESKTADRLGIVTAEHAILRKTPEDKKGDRDNHTDVMRGEFVWILDRHEDGSLLVHSSDGYLGWTSADAIRVVESSAALINVTTRPATTLPTAEAETLRALEERLLEARASTDAAMEELKMLVAQTTRTNVIADAERYLGTRYVWGGKTKDGIDCSGLMQTAYAMNGILLPRDADQQANVGRFVATRYFKDALLPGDLLFFASPKRGNISHVALHVGDGKYIEAAGKVGVRIASMNPAHPDYDEKRTKSFAWARRVID